MQIPDHDLLAALRHLNPWWVTGHLPAALAPPVRRLAVDEALSLLRIGTRRAIYLSGARRVGKTTMLYHLAETFLAEGILPEYILYLSFDHPLLKLAGIEKLLEVYRREIAAEAGRRLLLLDEVQYAPDWDLWVKQLVDRSPEWQIVTTGSASVLVQRDLQESGTGRWVTVQVPPLSFYEFLLLRKVEEPDLPNVKPTGLLHEPEMLQSRIMQRTAHLEPYLREYLLQGGFPETALAEDLRYAQRVMREDVVDKVLKRDMAALYQVRNVLELERLFLYLCLHSGHILSQEALAKDIGVSRTTVGRDLDHLTSAHLVYRLNPWGLGGKGMLRPRPKVYITHTSISQSVLLRGENALDDPTEMGALIESTVVTHVMQFYYRERPDLGYWKESRSGREVDLVVDLRHSLIGIEVKYREDARIRGGDGLLRLMQEASMPVHPLWITRRSEDYGPRVVPGTDKTVFRIPAYLFLYLLGRAERQQWRS